MYQCIFIHILCRREAAISWIYSFDAIEVLGRETSIIIIWFFFVFTRTQKCFYTYQHVGLVAHSYFNNFNYHLERKKETFLAILIDDSFKKMVKKLDFQQSCNFVTDFSLRLLQFPVEMLHRHYEVLHYWWTSSKTSTEVGNWKWDFAVALLVNSLATNNVYL